MLMKKKFSLCDDTNQAALLLYRFFPLAIIFAKTLFSKSVLKIQQILYTLTCSTELFPQQLAWLKIAVLILVV